MVLDQLDQVDDRGNHEPVDIDNKIETLENMFDDLQTRIRNELSTKPGITVQEVLSKLTGLPLLLRREYESSITKRIHGMRTETQINDLFIVHLNSLTSFIDYGLIEYVIKKFGSEGLKKDMRSYCSEMVVFMKETTIKQLIDHLPGQTEIPPKFSLIEAKIGRNASECTLEELNTLRKRFCSEVKLSEIVFHLVAVVESNSFIIRWLIPSALVSYVVKSAENISQIFYQEYKITSLTLDGMWLFMSETVIDVMWSQVHVSDTRFRDQFHNMYKQIAYELEMAQITLHRLSSFFENSLECQQSTSYLLSRELLNHKLPVSVVDFRVLAAAIEGFGSDCLKSVMSSYSKYISNFLKKSTTQQLINLSAIQLQPSGYSIVKCRIKEEPSHYTLDQLFGFRTKFCEFADLSELHFIMDKINTEMSGSFTVNWLVPLAFISMKVSKKVDYSLYHRFKITSLTLDGMWLHMSESEIDAMWSQVHMSDTKFKNQFHTMCKQIVHEMKMQNVSKYHLSLYFQTLNYQWQINYQLSQAILEEEFPASFVDFRVLKAVIERFGSDCLKRVMSSYCNYMLIFTKQSTAQQLINLSALQSGRYKHFVAAKCTIMEEPSYCRLEKLVQFQTRFRAIARFNEVCFIMDEVKMEINGSFTVSWLVPSALVSDIIAKAARYVGQSFYQEYKITSLTLDGMWLFLSAAEIDGMWLKMRVGDTELSDQFHIMHKQSLYELNRSTATDKLSSYLMDQQPTFQQDVSVKISKAILTPKFPISVVDFRMPAIVIELFGSNCLKRVMESYCHSMSTFVKQSTLKQLINLPSIQSRVPEYFLAAECKIKGEPFEYRLEKLLKFQTQFCSMSNIDKVCFVMGEVCKAMSGSFTVSWRIPSALVSYVVKFTRNIFPSFYQEYKIISLTLDGMWLYISESEIDTMWSELYVSDTKFKDQFRTMCKQIVCEMKMQNVSKDDLSLYFQTLNYQPQICDQLSLAVLNYELPASVVDFGVLEAVIERFGSDCLKRVMRSYCNYMPIFTKQSTAQQLINLSALRSEHWKHFVAAKCTITIEPSHCRLEKLLWFRTRFCAIARFNEVYFILDEVNIQMSGSFTVSWLVPSALNSDIIAKAARYVDQSFYQELKIASLTLDGLWLFLSEAEIDAMWSKMHVADTEFNDQFHIMHKQILCEVDRIERSAVTDKLSSYLMDQQPTLQRDVSVNISKAFLNSNFPISLINFRMLTIAIELFGSKCLKRVMESYCRFMSTFIKQSTLEHLIDLPPIQSRVPENFIIAEYKIKGEPFEYGLEKLLEFQSKFCSMFNIDKICFVMGEVRKKMSGSFTVSWYIPSAAVFHIVKFSRNSLYQEYNITSLTLDGMWIFLSDAEIDVMWLKMRVGDTEFNDQFHIMVKQILYEVDRIGRSTATDKLSSYLMNQQPTLQQDVRFTVSISKTFLNSHFPISLIDFKMLTIVIELFGSDCLKRVMESYCCCMSTFLKQSTLEQLIDRPPIQSRVPENFVTAECKIKGEPFEYGLEKLLEFRSKFCSMVNIDKICFVMGEVRKKMSGSFTVSWYIPSAAVSYIVKFSRNSLYQEYKITSLTLDGMWIFLSDTEIDVMMCVGDKEFNNQFHIMHKQILCEVDRIGRSTATDKLSSYYLMDQQPTLQQDVSVNISKAFLNSKFPIMFLIDLRMLTIVIQLFGSDCLKRVLESYRRFMSTFIKQSTLEQLIDLPPIQSRVPENFVIVECKIKGEPFEYGLEKLLEFQSKFCSMVNIDKIYFVMGKVRKKMSGSFNVSWYIPSAADSYILKFSGNSLYQEYKITSLTLDEMWIFLSDAEIDVMMRVGDTEFNNQFHIMHKQILYEVDRIGRSTATDKLSSYLMDQHPTLQRDVRLTVSISKTFLNSNFPISLIDFRMLTIATELFGNDCLKKVMESYCRFMSTFIKQSTLEQLIDLPPIQSRVPEDFVTAECKIKGEPFEYGLEKLLEFRTKFSSMVNIDKICFVMGKVQKKMSGSFTVSWHIPSAAVSYIVKCSRNSLYQEYNITSLTLDGMWIFLSDTEIDVMMCVGDTEFNNQFHIMHKQILYEVDRIGRSTATDKLSSYLMDQQPTLQRDVRLTISISKTFLNSNFPISLIDFRMLTIAIELFGSDCLKRVMESYCRFMSTFIKKSTLEQLIDLPPIQSRVPENFVTAECKIKDEPFEYGIEKILEFQSKFCSMFNIDTVCFVMGEVQKKMSGSFTVSWYTPSATVSHIVKLSRKSLYQEYKITSLTLDGMWIFLSDAEIDAMWHPSHFESQFLTMYRQIVCELKVQEISENELSSYLMDQQPKVQRKASIDLSEAFLEHAFPFSVLDFKVLSIVISKFGSDCLKNVMKSFHNYVYTRESTVKQLVSLPPIPSQTSKYFVSVESRNTEEPSDCRLARLLNFQARFCSIVNIDEVCFIIEAKTSDSFIVKWHVPSSLALELLKSANQLNLKQTELFQEMNMASLQLGGMWLYNYQLTPLGIQLRERYQQSQGSPSPVEWIPSPTRKIFRLAMIQRERLQQGHVEDRFVQMTISGRIDDILHAKSPVELEHIFRNTLHGGEIILIEGAPGSGKSTLTVHICQRWGRGELFQQLSVVILVQLRDPAVQRAQTIADLLPVENAEEIAAELIATNGRGVMWVLDGWDELPPHLQQQSIFCQLIKRMLSKCSVIVTSRPISSGDLQPLVSSRIEVLGFTQEEQKQYFTECLKGDTKALEALLEKIQENPVVQSICYLPLNAAFIVHTFKYRGQSLPNTEYEIYISVILSCIQRHYDREGRCHDLPRQLASLDDLSRSEIVRKPFQCLCELAYRGVMENKVTFSSSDLPQGSNTLSLLQAIESFLQGGKSVFYNFIHLSIQEVLSAYYITTKLSDSEQVSQFQQLFNQPRFAAVFQFYAAITKLKSPGIRQVIDRIVEAKSKPLLVSLLRCLHEAQDPDLCLYVAEGLEYRLDLSETSLSPLDCLSVSFFLSSIAGEEISANLARCQIGDLGAKCLTKYLSVSGCTGLVTINIKGSDIHDEGASHVAKLLYFIENLHLDVSENPIGDAGAFSILKALQTTSRVKYLTLVGYAVFSTMIEDILNALGQNNSLKNFDVFWNNPADKEVTQPSLDLKASIDKNVKLSAFINLHKIMKDRPKLSLNSTFCLSASEESNSFIITWRIPSVTISYLMELAKQIEMGSFEMEHILSLSVGNLWLYNTKLNPFGSTLKQRYQQSQGSPSPVEWLPSPTKKIFRLAMIQRENVQQGYNNIIKNIFLPEPISVRVDDSPLVDHEHIFRNTLHGGSEIILIEGAPGSGKSTLTVHICQGWGKGELFQQFTVVILVQLRDPAVQRAQTIADLLPVENAEEIAAELIATNGRGVLWVLDGWDELPLHLQQDSIFCTLIKRMPRECSVIVTSHPISSGDLHPVVSSRIEVLGFTPEEQRQYFTDCLKGDTKALETLLEKIQENPVVQSICYLPLNAAFIVHTFKHRDRSLPNTEYEIYLSVILSCIQRYYDREGRGHDLPGELECLDDLFRSEAVREPFQYLCELAYRGVMENKVTFSSSDWPQGSNTLSLLQAIESFLQSGKSVFYNFLHLSIQEVLSAYYITTKLSDSEQVSQFQQLFNQPRFAAVFQFYAAITKLKSPGIRQVIDRIVETKSKPLLVSLLRCLHVAQNPDICLYVAERLENKLDLSETSLSPQEFLCLGYFCSSFPGKEFTATLRRCYLDDLGANFLTKFLNSDVHYASNLAIDFCGSNLNQKDALHIAKILYFIEHLYLTNNPIGDNGASLISEAVRETATLKTLILHDCGITLRGAKELSRALTQNSSLEKLDISDNNLGDEGISHVAEALKQNKRLKELWIGDCRMTDRGAYFLASALTVNNSLKMLHMGGPKGDITEDGLSTIAQSTARALVNKSLLVKLVIPAMFGRTTAGRLSQVVNEARTRNRLAPIEIESEYNIIWVYGRVIPISLFYTLYA